MMIEFYFYLKSNMDRFIEMVHLSALIYFNDLKSNMDRFIVGKIFIIIKVFKKFKIQYG